MMNYVRWLVGAGRWSKAHKTKDNVTTVCHIIIPRDTPIDKSDPNDAPRCKRCEGNWR